MATRRVIHPQELWSIPLLMFWSFIAGLTTYLGVVISAAAAILQEWQLPPMAVCAIVLVAMCVPWLFLWRFQYMVRTWRRALVSGTACGLGAVSLAIIFSIGNPDPKYWLGVAVGTGIAILFYSLSNMGLLALFNKLRSPPPIQDGTLCPGCGYCLIGNQSMICPECGRPFTYEELRELGGSLLRSGTCGQGKAPYDYGDGCRP